MKTYNVQFNGRTKGAIGVTYWISAVVVAENEEAANLKLYEKWEHISFARFTELTLYQALIAAGVECSNWQSDLYFPVTEKTTEILSRFPLQQSNSSTFKSNINGELSYDVPFAYEPHWSK
jgi:hypothetical protein